MLIDWFTVIAQIINFLILVVLLKRFLYRPVMQAMDERTKAIADRQAEAERKQQEAEQEAAAYRTRTRDLESQRETMLAGIQQDVDVYRKDHIDRARDEIEAIRARWHETLLHEQHAFLQDLRQQSVRQIYAIARRVLKDLAEEELEHRIAETFITHLRGLSEKERQEISMLLQRPDQTVVIRSAFEPAPDMRQRIIQSIRELDAAGRSAQERNVAFSTAPDLVCGIELKIGGYKIAWHVDDYLETLESQISKTLEEETGQDTG